jgi:hypothetical protein
MKRFRFLLLLAVLLSAGAAVYAKSGETKTIVRDGKTIRITIIDGDDDDDFDFDVPRHGRSRDIIINGRPLSEILDLPLMRGHRNDAWFVCPKDHAMLRVPEPKEGDSFKCPVDGTTMDKRKAPAFSVFFANEL